MNTYLRGTELLGALGRIDEENFAITKKIDRRLIAGTLIGAVAGALGLTFVWKTHRVIGGILGLFFVGPAIGGGGGLLFSLGDFRKIQENQAKKQELASGPPEQRPAPESLNLFVPF